MPRLGKSSDSKLCTCHTDIQTVFRKVIERFDYVVIYGYRGKEEQDKAFSEGKSKLKWPDSLHNKTPSMAIDVAPFDNKLNIDWNDIKRFYYFAGFVMATAQQLYEDGRITHLLRYGGDWDGDTEIKDNTFNDLGHFELIVVNG